MLCDVKLHSVVNVLRAVNRLEKAGSNNSSIFEILIFVINSSINAKQLFSTFAII